MRTPATEASKAPIGLSDLLMRVLDEIDYGLVLVNEDAQVRYANQVALGTSVLGFEVSQGKVNLNRKADQKSLLKALWLAHRGTRSLMTVSVPNQEWMIGVVPLNEPTGRATLLLLSKNQLCAPLSIDFYARHHHLTNTESAVLRALCEGLKPQQVASSLGVAISTIRTHLSRIREKTDTRNIRDLLCRVTALPPILTALHQRGRSFSDSPAIAA
jgi:DNA-binding CsgD family transcriptional regulator